MPPGHLGLSEILAERTTLADSVLMTHDELPDVVIAGEPNNDPSEHLASPEFAKLLNELRGSYDFVFIDTPPVIPVTDALVVAPLCDAVLVVARIGYTTPARLQRALTSLGQVRAQVLGVVANCARGSSDRDYRYGYATYHETGTRTVAEALQPKAPRRGKRAGGGSHAR